MSNQTTLTRIEPLADRIVGQKLEEEKKVGGIILPDSAKKEQQLVRILRVGPGKTDQEGNVVAMPVTEGDIVLMEKYAGLEVSLDNEDFVICRADEIVAKVQQ